MVREQARSILSECRGESGIEGLSGTTAHRGDHGVTAGGPGNEDGPAGDVGHADRERQVFAAQLAGCSLAVPSLIELEQRLLDGGSQAEPAGNSRVICRNA